MSERYRGNRITGSARPARVIMIAIAVLFFTILALSFGDFSRRAQEQGVVAGLLVIAMVVRSRFFGIYVGRETVRVVSWFRNYDTPIRDIDELLDLPYNDYWTMGASPMWLQRRLRNAGMRIAGRRRVRAFPVTIASASSLRRVMEAVAARIDRPIRRIEFDTDPV